VLEICLPDSVRMFKKPAAEHKNVPWTRCNDKSDHWGYTPNFCDSASLFWENFPI
jgi:hypothetical protein